jgi:hypothetical protein
VAAAWLAREWWKTRSAQRADAVDSANAKGQINMLADFERRAKEAESEADKERQRRIELEGRIAMCTAKLYVAAQKIASQERELERRGAEPSDWGALQPGPRADTLFAELMSGEPPAPP